jgi:hypothetical protein
MRGECFTLRCKDNSFMYNKICFTGQSAFLLDKNTKKSSFLSYFAPFSEEKRKKKSCKNKFSLLLQHRFTNYPKITR